MKESPVGCTAFTHFTCTSTWWISIPFCQCLSESKDWCVCNRLKPSWVLPHLFFLFFQFPFLNYRISNLLWSMCDNVTRTGSSPLAYRYSLKWIIFTESLSQSSTHKELYHQGHLGLFLSCPPALWSSIFRLFERGKVLLRTPVTGILRLI